MKTDPDFHPLAAAWLNGATHEGERRLLGELLAADAQHVETWASLCHTEALLHLHGRQRPAAAELARLLLKSRVQRVLHSPWLRWSAAALVAAGFLLWVFWPAAGDGGVAKGHRSQGSGIVQPGTVVHRAETKEDAENQPAIGKWQRHFQRSFVGGLTLLGGLREVLPTLERKLQPLNDAPIPLMVEGEPDAPVYLKLRASLTAWTLLQMVACQTGMTLSADDEAVRFTPAARPYSRTAPGSASLSLTHLRTLLDVRSSSDHSDELGTFSLRAREAFGMEVTFSEDSETSARMTGSARDVAILVAARDGLASSPRRVLVVIQSCVRAQAVKPVESSESATLAGVFSQEQFHTMIESAAADAENQFGQPISKFVLPGQEATVSSQSRRDAIVKSIGTVDLIAVPGMNGIEDVSLSIEAAFPARKPAAAPIETKLLLFPGQTVAIKTPDNANGTVGYLYITPTSIETDALQSATPNPSGPAPFAIPVAGKPGFALSPWAPDTAPVDISGHQPNSRIPCPVTGKPLTVP